MTSPTQNNGSPSEQNNRLFPPAPSPATSLVNTIDGARQNLPFATPASTPSPLPRIQREPATELSGIFAAVLRSPATTEFTPAPAILQKPACEHIIDLLRTSVDQKKNALPEPRWYYQYLARHIDEFQNRDILQRLFNCLRNAASFGYLPSPGRQESETLSQLVCRFCSYAQNSKEFVIAYEQLIFLITKLQHDSRELILSPVAFHRFLDVLKVVPSFHECPGPSQAALFTLASFYSKSMTIEWDHELVDCFARQMVDFYKREDLLFPRMATTNIPGIIHPLLTQGDLTAAQRLELCNYCSRSGTIISPFAREKLRTLCEEIADSTGTSIMEQDNQKADNDAIARFRFQMRDQIVSAIACFGTIASRAQFAPLTQDEIAVLAKLIRHLPDISPNSHDINIVLSSLTFLFQPHSFQDLTPLEDAIVHLMKVAVNSFDMRCVSRHSDGYKFLTIAHQIGSRISSEIFLELLSRLKDVVSTEENFSERERIAKAFCIAGLIAEFPVKMDCREVVTQAFGALALLLIPSPNIKSSSLDDLIAMLLSHFAREPVEATYDDDLCQLFSGLGMMARHQLFHRVPESDKGQTFRKLLECYHSMLGEGELTMDETEDDVEILFWIGSMVEMCEKSPGLNPLFDGQQFTCVEILLENIPETSDEASEKLLLGLGKLVVHNRLRHLSSAGKDSLNQLITVCFKNLRDEKQQKALDYSEFLYFLSHLYQRGFIGRECMILSASCYRPFLVHKWKESPSRSIEQISKILYFIDAVQSLQTEKDSAPLDEKVKFAACIREMKTQMEHYLTQTRRDGNKMFSPRKRQKT